MEKPLIYIDPRKAYELDQEIAKSKKVKDRNLALQKPTILIDSQKAYDLDQQLALQKLYYRPEGLYQNIKGLWDACKKAGYNFLFNDVKKWLDSQAIYQIFRPLPRYVPYASYSKITKLNSVHQCDLIEILCNEDVDTDLLDNSPIFYYVLLVIDCATRYKDFIFLTSKSSEEVAEAFKSIYDNPDNPLNWPRLLQCDEGREFMGSVTLIMDEHNVNIRRIKARFRHTSMAMVDRYAESFELRVFKNQYAIEFLLPTGERCRECERFARRIVDNINDTTTRLIGMSPNDTTKLERVYSKPSIKYNRPIGVDEPRLSKGTTIRFLLAPGEWENDPFERHRITDPIWSPSLHKIRRIVVGKNPPMPVLYYLDESGPRCPFVREQLMHIKEEPILPPRWVLGDNRMHIRRSL
ncbi:hypothetical protein F8M41_025930 [Gigaspora margarita]|uniref:Integrase catalytic domain-containing protein n=2 Tax=Gigaspora margarita TaxID=4874 RepID=A0A8H4AAP3_GIGMA|nr:hypothetical protein F8M41_025930 [Gigaspora margarita]